MQKITTFLSYDHQAEEAARLYVSIFETGSRVVSTAKGPDGKVLTVTFELFGQRYLALNAGPNADFKFTNGVSLMVECETQEELDRYWNGLVKSGGQEVMCGWCKDKFGLPWQITPRVLGEMIGHADREKAGRAFQAMLGMKKLDIAALQRAFDGR